MLEIIIGELKKVSVTAGILSILALFLSLLCGVSVLTALVSVLFGSLFALANFFLLGTLCDKACKKTPAKAKSYMQLHYTLRLLLTAVVITASFKVPYLHPIGVILPLFAPKLTYFSTAIYETIRKK